MKKTARSDLAMTSHTELASAVDTAWGAVGQSFDQFCLIAGVAALSEMLEDDLKALAGDAHPRSADNPGYRWGRTKRRVGFHGGKVALDRPRVRSKSTDRELPLPSWQEAAAGGWLEEWAMSLILMNVATRKFGRAVRLPEADISAAAGSGLSKSAFSRPVKALTEARLADWMASDLSELDLLVIRIDGLHMDDNLLMIGAVGVDADGGKHPLGVPEGATENAATVQAQPDNLIERRLDPEIWRRFIVDGAKALAKAIRRTAQGRHPDPAPPGPGSARNITERIDPKLHAAVRRTLHQAWEIDDATKAERLLRNLARRLELQALGVSKSILEGLDKILTVTRLGLPPELRRSLASTTIIESMNAVIRQVCRNVKRWRDAQMAVCSTAVGMTEAA